MATHSRRLGRIVSAVIPRFALLLVLLLALAVPTLSHAQIQYEQFEEYDLVMHERPKLYLEYRSEEVFPDGLAELWGRALQRPDAELQRLVIDTVAIAHRRGVEGMVEFTPRLVELAKTPSQPLDLLRATAQTLIVLDARDQIPLLAELTKEYGTPIGQIVEPALAQWQSPVMVDTWLDRIRGQEGGSAMIVLAIHGLVALEDERASEPLQAIVRNVGQTSQMRIAAARGLGNLHETGLVDLARELSQQVSQPASLNGILAVQLLGRHADPQSVELLKQLVESESSIVQSEALGQLYRIDFNLLDPYCDTHLSSNDVNVRRWCLRAMVDAKRPNRIALICRLLDDVNPTLRRDAARSLISLADDPGLTANVIEETTKVLAENPWRGCEQATVVLTRLDHKPCGPRLVELLGHQRGEVQVAAAWGLTKLRVEELLPDMLDHAQRVYEGFRSGTLNDNMPGKALHVAHLFNAFGDQKYQAAESLMREYLPKDHSLGLESRAAAAWAIGMFYVDDPQDDLVSIFVGRLYDNYINPDTDLMRDMCAVSIGRMKAESALPDLRKFPGMASCYWAIEQMTGEKPPQSELESMPVDDWFLAPVRPQSE